MADTEPKNPFKDLRPLGTADPSLNILREGPGKDPRELEQQIQKLNQLKETLRLTSREYVQAEAAIKKYTAALVKLRMEKSQLTIAAQKLISSMGTGGSAGVFTKFASTTADLGTSIDKTTGFMKVFGAQTSMTAGAFVGWLTAIQVGLALLGKYLDFQDNAQKRQGELQRAFGSTNVSIGESFKAAASGWNIAGKTGAEAAEQINYIARQARGGLMEQLTGGTAARMGLTGLDQLVALTAGFSKKVPEYLERLTTVFGGRTAKDTVEVIQKIGMYATKSGAPLEMMTEMILNLGEQFVLLGGDIDQAIDAHTTFMDAVGKAQLAPGLVQTMARVGMQEQMTAAGLQGRFLTTVFTSRMFETLPQKLREGLDASALKLGFTGFQAMPFMRKAELMGNLAPGEYLETKRSQLNFARQIAATRGEPVATAFTMSIAGMEFKQLDTIFKKLDENAIKGEDAAKQLREATKTNEEKLREGLDNFITQNKTIAYQQQEFYSQLMSTLKTLQGGFITIADQIVYGEKGYRGTREQTENVRALFEQRVRDRALMLGRPLNAEEVKAMMTEREYASYIQKARYEFEETQEKLGRFGGGAFTVEPGMLGIPTSKVDLSKFVPPKTFKIPSGMGGILNLELTLKSFEPNPAAVGSPSKGTQSTGE